MPCHNAEAFVEEALHSVLAQTYPPHEVFVVDDQSTDGTRAVVQRVAAEHPVVRLVTPAERVYGDGARNVGIALAAGDLIATMDADDVWEPEHLALSVAAHDAHPEIAVSFTGVRLMGGPRDGVVEMPSIPATGARHVLDELVRFVPGYHPTTVFRRAAIAAVGNYTSENHLADDYHLYLRLAPLYPFAFIHRCTLNYRIHPGQVSAREDRQLVAAYRARRSLWETWRTRDAAIAARIAAGFRARWHEDVETAWTHGDPDRLAFYWALRAEVPRLPLALRLRYGALLRGMRTKGWMRRLWGRAQRVRG